MAPKTDPTADQIIELLNLEPLPGEGGYFRETLKSEETIPAGVLPSHQGPRSTSTQIYYLLKSGSASKLHRVRSDEVFHHYLGAPVTQLRIDPEGNTETVTIGPDLLAGHRPQVIVPKHWWQGAILTSDTHPEPAPEPDPDAFALLGCTVSPGFEWDDFELIDPRKEPRVADTALAAHPWASKLL